eukprot:scaffold14855_cov19-Tisochrysis_lutea.AAC.1
MGKAGAGGQLVFNRLVGRRWDLGFNIGKPVSTPVCGAEPSNECHQHAKWKFPHALALGICSTTASDPCQGMHSCPLLTSGSLDEHACNCARLFPLPSARSHCEGACNHMHPHAPYVSRKPSRKCLPSCSRMLLAVNRKPIEGARNNSFTSSSIMLAHAPRCQQEAHRRWLDIIAARKIILQIVQRFNGDSPAYARAVNQTSYATHSSAWAPQDSLLTQRRYYDPRPPQQEQQHSLQEQKEHVAGSSGSSSSTGTSGQAQEAVHGSGLPPSSLAGGQAASTGLEAGGTGSKADVTAPANVPVDMRAFVEAPPIMPHSCSPRTMAQQRKWHAYPT